VCPLAPGADVYGSKPIHYPELAARIRRALGRGDRPQPTGEVTVIDGRLALDRPSREVVVDGRPVALSDIEYRLLACFVDNAGRTLTHQCLLLQAWGWECRTKTHYLRVYVHHLRKKIEKDPARPRYIRTDWGAGYRFQPL
jgi:two-component system KDP operon response regulator KdpE